MSHLIRGFAAAATVAIVATSVWSSSPRAESITGSGSWMGVRVAPLNEGWREQYSYARAGVRVTEVEPDGPADRIGIVTGDILVAVGTTSLRKESDLAIAQTRTDPSQPVSVVIARNNGSLVKIRTMEPTPVPEVEPLPEPKPDASVGVALVGAASEASPGTAEPKQDPLTTLGVQCANLNEDLASVLGASKQVGVLVLEVSSGGKAERVGIRAGDVISAAGNQTVGHVEALARALAAAPSGTTLHVLRRGEERDVTVSLVSPRSSTETEKGKSALEEEMEQELRSLRQEIEALRAEIAAKKAP